MSSTLLISWISSTADLKDDRTVLTLLQRIMPPQLQSASSPSTASIPLTIHEMDVNRLFKCQKPHKTVKTDPISLSTLKHLAVSNVRRHFKTSVECWVVKCMSWTSLLLDLYHHSNPQRMQHKTCPCKLKGYDHSSPGPPPQKPHTTNTVSSQLLLASCIICGFDVINIFMKDIKEIKDKRTETCFFLNSIKGAISSPLVKIWIAKAEWRCQCVGLE